MDANFPEPDPEPALNDDLGRSRPRVESPCIRHCTLDDDDVCVGCLRHIDEICAWSGADDEQRLEILERAAARRRER